MARKCLHNSNKLNKNKISKIIKGLKNNINDKRIECFVSSLHTNSHNYDQGESCICKNCDSPQIAKQATFFRNKSLSDIVINKSLLDSKVRQSIIKLFKIKEDEESSSTVQ